MPKTTIRKTSSRPRLRGSKSNNNFSKYKVSFIVFIVLFILFSATVYHFRRGLAYYLGFKTTKKIENLETKRLSDIRNFEILSKYDDKVAGIDVSEYQGTINWSQVEYVENEFPIQFVFIRSTAGAKKADLQFENNWQGSKENNIIRGAYHYYRPDENSQEQAFNFISSVKLEKGDLPPILDIEKLPRKQSISKLKLGLQRWLDIVEAHYKVKPIIYTGEKYYKDFLKNDFKGYTFWIANYNFFVEELKEDWTFWQFTEKSSVVGIEGNVDVNIYNGTPKMLGYLTIN
jgi:lysozyme